MNQGKTIARLARVGCLHFTLSVLLLIVVESKASYQLADQPMVLFDRFGTADGLTPGAVTAFTQDHYGFIWVGTQEGLNRYDGYQVERYFHQRDNPNSIRHDNVWSLLSDSSNRFWVGTDAGLNLYDHDTKMFAKFDLGREAESGQKTAVFALHEDVDGNIWVGNGFGLARIGQDGIISRYEYDLEENGISNGAVRAIFQSTDNRIWIGTDQGGASVLDPVTGQFVNYSPADIRGKFVRDIVEDDDGRIWFATYEYEVAVSIFDPSDQTWKYLSQDQAGIGSNRVRSLLKDEVGNIWIGTDFGLSLWQYRENKLQRYNNDISNQKSISENTIISLFQDRGGVIWVGTMDGISKWNASVVSFRHYKQSDNSSLGLIGSQITSFAEADNSDVWIGTFRGVSKWNSSIGEMEGYFGSEIGLSDEKVMAVLDNGDEVFLGTMGGGLNVMRNGLVKDIYVNDPNDPASISAREISALFRDSKDRIWIATYGGGVNQYLGNGRFKRFPDSLNVHGKFSELRCTDIKEGIDGNLWISTDGGGVVVLNPDTGYTKIYNNDPSDLASLSSNNIVTTLSTKTAVWIGTRDHGIDKFDRKSRTFTNYDKGAGLQSDSIYGLLEDEFGRIWMSGGKGLSVLDPSTEEFVLYNVAHGLQSDDFHSNAFLKLSDGAFLFGGNNGFNAFQPAQITKNQFVPPVRLTSFLKFNKEVALPRTIDRMEVIELEHDESVIGFKFSSLDYTAPEKNQYKYFLEGFDADWVEAGHTRQATYTNLDPGSYTFRVRGSNNDGVWGEEGTSIKILVNPPLWATWWAYTAYVLLALFLLYQLLQANTRRQRLADEKRHAEQLQLYVESLEEATDCVLIADNDTHLMYANDAIRDLIGISPGEAIGRPLLDCLFQGEALCAEVTQALQQNGRYHGEVNHTSETGERKTLEVTIAAVTQASDERSGYVSISRDVTQRKITEAELENYSKNLQYMVSEQTSELERRLEEIELAKKDIAESLEEKELLLKEVHHRVKNNMQVISSLLNIQAETVGDDYLATLLGESQQRIKSMSLIHENLYQSESLLEIDFSEYITMLANSLCRFYTVPGVSVLLDVDVKDIHLDIETAVPCGLIINELVSNSLKHAFDGKQKNVGTISISFAQAGCNYVLRISDDGKGLPDDFSMDGSSMGMEIVSILTQQLDGKLSVVQSQGAGFEISFPRKVKHD